MTHAIRVFMATVAAALLVVLAADVFIEPDEPPHTRPQRAATQEVNGPGGAAPGSSLEGIGDRVRATGFAVLMEINRQEQVLAEAAAVEAAAEATLAEIEAAVPEEPAPETFVSSPGTESFGEWDWQALCETGGDWSMQGSSYSGGLGFYNGSWDAYGGQEFASNAGLATREQQIIVAERIQDVPPVNDANDACTGW